MEELSKEEQVLELLKNSDNINDILQNISIWGLKQIQNPELNKLELRDICNKISECNVVIANICKENTEHDINLLKNTLLSWILKEKTPLEYTAKYR